MRKRAAALILSVVMTLGAVLTGCGSGGPQANSGSEGRVRRMAVAAEKKWLACA